MTPWGEAYTTQHTAKSNQARWVVRLPTGVIKYEHILVWEAAHGPLPRGWVIHHKDGDPLNNALENLQAMPKGAHTRMHRRQQMLSHSIVSGIEGKVCHACKTWKPLPEFPRNGRSRIGTIVYRPACSSCYARQQRLERE
jgi:hypothetical protein